MNEREDAIRNLEACKEQLQELVEDKAPADKLNDHYLINSGRAWAYMEIGLLSFDEAYSYVKMFAKIITGQGF